MPRFASLDVTSAFGPALADAGSLERDLAATALDAAKAAAAVLQSGVPGGVETKTSATDLVTDVDREAEAAVGRVLQERRPADSILGEEGTSREGSSGVGWVVDPLDGTTNYLFGVPQYCVSVAAATQAGTCVGVVMDPCRDETWAAVRGYGSFMNGSASRVANGRSTLSTALVATGFGYRSERREWQATVAQAVIPAVRDIRRFGAAALDLCWTAGGRYDAYYEWGLNPWDLAAGALICSEAGGRVETLPGRLILAATPDLFEPLSSLLESAGGFDAAAGPEPVFWEVPGFG